MTLEPHELRVIAERNQLDERREKLKAFMASPASKGLDPFERARLVRQSMAMKAYSDVLAERIDAFVPPVSNLEDI